MTNRRPSNSFQRLEEASGYFTMQTHSYTEEQSCMNIGPISEVYQHNQPQSPQSTTVSRHKFGDRGYNDDVLRNMGISPYITASNVSLYIQDDYNLLAHELICLFGFNVAFKHLRSYHGSACL